MSSQLTLADHNVALEVDSVAFGKLEHGEQFGLSSASLAVVLELRHDGPVWTASVVYQLHCGIEV